LKEYIGRGSEAGALHVRGVSRRAERAAVRLAEAEKVNDQTVTYLIALSDLLFVWMGANRQRSSEFAQFPRHDQRPRSLEPADGAAEARAPLLVTSQLSGSGATTQSSLEAFFCGGHRPHAPMPEHRDNTGSIELPPASGAASQKATIEHGVLLT